MITYKRASLFDAPPGSILVHACNCCGQWGPVIAAQFKERYPKCFDVYRDFCAERHVEHKIGTALLISTHDDYVIGNLFTSRGYGRNADRPDQIMAATKSALIDLAHQNKDGLPVAMCKINAGQFRVPWAETENLINYLGMNVTVYDPNLTLETFDE